MAAPGSSARAFSFSAGSSADQEAAAEWFDSEPRWALEEVYVASINDPDRTPIKPVKDSSGHIKDVSKGSKVSWAHILRLQKPHVQGMLQEIIEERRTAPTKELDGCQCLFYKSLPRTERYATAKITRYASPRDGFPFNIFNIFNGIVYPHQLVGMLWAFDHWTPAQFATAVEHVDSLERGQKSTLVTASHLCHNNRCCRIGHLVLESQEANNARINCPGEITCPHCSHKHNACKHGPWLCCPPEDPDVEQKMWE